MTKKKAKQARPAKRPSRKFEVMAAFGQPSVVIRAHEWLLSDNRLQFVSDGATECNAIFNSWQWFRELTA